jgi:RND family efflux transporter MFP subunit
MTVRRGVTIGHICCLAIAAACGREASFEKPLTPVKVQKVQTSSPNRGPRYSVNIRPYAQVDLAFKVGGYVEKVLQVPGPDGKQHIVEPGDRFRKGTVLARLRQSDYLVKLNEAIPQQAEAQAGLEKAKLDFDRAANLLAAQSLTKADYDGFKAQYDASLARLDLTKHQREEIEIALRDSTLKTPIDAVVLKRNIEVGTLVSPGSVAFTLADTSSMKAVFGVPDFIVQNLKLGTPLVIVTEAFPGVEFTGRISGLSPAADPKSLIFDVQVTIPNPGNQLQAGLVATVLLPGENPPDSHPAVPVSAIVRPPGVSSDYAVYVVEDREGKPVARLRPVRLGDILGDTVAVTQGVTPGEHIIVSGASRVTDGEPVQVMP